MSDLKVHYTRHTTSIAAPADHVYKLITDVNRWPQIFRPAIAVNYLGGTEDTQRMRIWALANGQVRNWISARELDHEKLILRFRQEVSTHPVSSMGGEWQVIPRKGGCEVVLLHDYQVVDDNETDTAWVASAVERNSNTELTALRATAELGGGIDDVWMSFSDTMDIEAPANEVYDFLATAQRWPQRLPHVTRLQLAEPDSDVQQMVMDTTLPDGSTHTTASIRICFPTTKIVYKQTRVPAIMSAHTGTWSLSEIDGGVRAKAHHTVVLEPDAIKDTLGSGASLQDARSMVRTALGGNSMATMLHAKQFTESGTD